MKGDPDPVNGRGGARPQDAINREARREDGGTERLPAEQVAAGLEADDLDRRARTRGPVGPRHPESLRLAGNAARTKPADPVLGIAEGAAHARRLVGRQVWRRGMIRA